MCLWQNKESFEMKAKDGICSMNWFLKLCNVMHSFLCIVFKDSNKIDQLS